LCLDTNQPEVVEILLRLLTFSITDAGTTLIRSKCPQTQRAAAWAGSSSEKPKHEPFSLEGLGSFPKSRLKIAAYFRMIGLNATVNDLVASIFFAFFKVFLAILISLA
jgi:hypothetical protein